MPRFSTLIQKYVYRPIDRLSTTYRTPTIVVLAGAFIPACALIFLYGNSTDPVIIARVLPTFFAPMLAAAAVFILPMFYDHAHDQARDIKLANALVATLMQTGPLPVVTLRKHYNSHHRFHLPIEVSKLLTRDYTAHLFLYDRRAEMVTATGEVASTATAIPMPADGDYKTGYYQLYARLRAIREHPELVTVQDSLIDNLYGIG